jgi:hypothetical protein
MSTCKDCIHFVACVDFLFSDYDCCENIEKSKEKHANDEACAHFKPTADAVEVVRCRDCKLRYTEGGPMMAWDCGELMGETEDNDYCSYGERRSENEG